MSVSARRLVWFPASLHLCCIASVTQSDVNNWLKKTGSKNIPQRQTSVFSTWHHQVQITRRHVLDVLVYAFSTGYDVQSASTPEGELYITGAPRYNHTGRVVIYRLNEKKQIVITQIIKGEQVRGFVFVVWARTVFLKSVLIQFKDDEIRKKRLLCSDWFLLRQRPTDCGRGRGLEHRSPLDRSSDVHGFRKRRAGSSLRLQSQQGTGDWKWGSLVSLVEACWGREDAPSGHLSCVFSLLFNQDGQFEHEFTLKPVNQSCCTAHTATCTNKNEPCGARFGTAIAAVSDLNLDGFNDVAIGAPFENDHRGAVYIYHGAETSLKEKFVQVRTVSVPLLEDCVTIHVD